MRPFETADVVFIETLKAKHATVKTQLAAAERAQDAQHVAEIAAEREKADKAIAGFCGRRLARRAGGRARQAVVATADGLSCYPSATLALRRLTYCQAKQGRAGPPSACCNRPSPLTRRKATLQ